MMSTRTQDETTGPLGVIGCLATGFEMLGQRVWLVALPVLLDLLLWLGARLSVVPLLEAFVAILKAQPFSNPEMGRQVAQAIRMLEQFGDRFNLLSSLSGLPLLHVPSLLARHAPGAASPLGEHPVLRVTSVPMLTVWWVALVFVGLVLGFLYLNSVAHWVRATYPLAGQRPAAGRTAGVKQAPGATDRDPSPALRLGVVKFVRVILFAVGTLAAAAMFVALWSLPVTIATVITPSLGLVAWMIGLWLGGYVVLHLLFVVHGVLLGGRRLLQAAWESVVLVHTHLPSAMGLVVLIVIIYEGLGYVWSLPAGDSWLLLIGILGNGCVATGLTAATFVFYQERMRSA